VPENTDPSPTAGAAPFRLVTFLAPCHNEAEALPTLVQEIRAAAATVARPYEILLVDDGSDDGSAAWLDAEQARSPDLRVFHMPRRGGQSAALAAGLDRAGGDVIVTMDSDLQDDPAQAPALLDALARADLACGVRQRRRDGIGKRIASRFANWFRRIMLKDSFRDVGCNLRAYRRPVAQAIPRFHGFHRFVPILARAEGFSVVEVPVKHRPRPFGRTHYGNLSRGLRGAYDLLGVGWLLRRRIPRMRDQ